MALDPRTDLGAGGDAFPPTAWSMVQGLNASAERPAALQDLCQRYWRPIYCYVRSAWRKSNEDAKDLTQGFFTWLVTESVLERYDPSRAQFRYYLKGILRNYVAKQETAKRALKRGGGAAPIPYDALEAFENALPPSATESPEEAFDRGFVRDLLVGAVDRVRARCEAQGEADRFRVYELYEMAPAGTKPTYASVAKELGLRPALVRHRLSEVRELLRVEVRALLRETVSSPEQLEVEWQALFGAEG